VFQGSFQDVGDDFHVPMPVSGKALAGLYLVFVNYSQAGESQVIGVIVIAERKGMSRVEPAKVGGSSFSGRTDGNHGRSLLASVISPIMD
jgi:hypothetical protein